MSIRDLPSQKEFIEYLSGLAEQEETFLFVRQKPTTGFYNDGTLRATWPAFLPEESGAIKKDWAVYGNTGSFLKDRLTGKVSASSANCEHVLCMVLDDIGTKSKEPPLPPTWVMETSEGNYQWGYVFSEQPGRGAFAAAIRAIAEAGFTDPGACNPVRNFRLPGSVNLKTGKNGFRSRLVGFHPDREFKLEEICEALGVTPGEDEGDGFRSLKIKRQDDDVLNWLSDRGLLLSPPNSEGWCQIVCPNHAGHSDPNDVMAKYNTNDRGFVCFHEHCQHLTSQAFLDWVAAEGGPEVEHGADIDSEIDELGEALRTQYPGEMTPETAQALDDITKRQNARAELKHLHQKYAYLMSDDGYFDLDTRKWHPRKVFNALYKHLPAMSGAGKKVEVSTWFDEFRTANGGLTLEGQTYAAGDGVTVVRFDGVYGNTWRDARVKPSSRADVTPWLDHCRRLVPDDDERNHMLDVMAYKLQYPKKKINHAILLAGTEGCGKDTMFKPLIMGISGDGTQNVKIVSSEQLHGDWGNHFESELLILNEIKESKAAERKALANKLKPIIAAPPDFLTVNKKHQSLYEVANRLFVLAFSNERNPISLSSGDRRWFVVWTEAKRPGDEYFHHLWGWFDKGGMDACIAWLHRRDVSKFNPAAPPRATEYKTTMVEGGRSTVEAWLIELMQGEIGEFQGGVVGGSFLQLSERLQGTAPDRVTMHHAAITDALHEAGWEFMGKLHSRDNPTKKQVWVSQRVYTLYKTGKYSKSALRDLVERESTLTVMTKGQLC